jgi:hypothetical protein
MNFLNGMNKKLVESFLKNAMEKNEIQCISIFYENGELTYKSFTEEVMIFPKSKIEELKNRKNGTK